MKEKGKRCMGGFPLREDPLTRKEGGMGRKEALGPKWGKNPGQGGVGVGVGGCRRHWRRRGKETERNRKRQDRKGERQRRRKTVKGRDKRHREKTGRGRECQSKGQERRGRRRADKVSVVLVTGWDSG